MQLSQRNITRRKIVHWLFITLCAVIVVIAATLITQNSLYLGWDFTNPETAIIGTAFHTFEWLFFRLSSIMLAGGILGVVLTRKKH